MKVFDTVPVKIPAKNVFNLSHDVKASYNFDNLYPFLCQPVYPGDTWNVRAEAFLRAMPMLAPVMHNVDMHIYFFFVPFRLIWNENKKRDWKTYITGGEDGMQNPPLPYFTYRGLYDCDPDLIDNRSLLDHMGFPTFDHSSQHTQGVINDTRVCSLPFRAYQLVWNEYFRNQNVQNEVVFSYDAGEESDASMTEIFTMRKKNWEKDYFTSCLPWAQRGQAISLPVTGELRPVGSMPVSITTANALGSETERGLSSSENFVKADGLGTSTSVTLNGLATSAGATLRITGLSIGTINDFRYCMRLQQWLENNARCGSRYIEQLFAHFGVRSSDARLQRPELLGGGKIPLLFTDIPQTSYGEGASSDVVGDLSGKGTLYGKTDGFKKYFEEHGVLLGICCMIPRTSYSQGIPRVWTAFDKTDWYFPEFAHLGEQAVLNKELYYDPFTIPEQDNDNDAVFGYQGRFTELRYIASSVHGEMRSDLQYWHFGRLFDSAPALNSQFVQANSRVNVFALSDIVQSGYDPFVCQMHLDIKAVRPLPKYAVPTL